MKVRKGFVSNSSSASFIIGVAVIHKSKVKEANKVDYLEVTKITDLESDCSIENNTKHKIISVESFDGTEVYIKYNTDKDYVAILDEKGYDPEYNEVTEEYDYDEIELTDDWFNAQQLKAADFILNCGGKVAVGGGRDG